MEHTHQAEIVLELPDASGHSVRAEGASSGDGSRVFLAANPPGVVTWLDLTAEHVYECRLRLSPEAEGGYSIVAVDLPGVASEGESIEDALKNAHEAVHLALASYIHHGEMIPWVREPADAGQLPGEIDRWIRVGV